LDGINRPSDLAKYVTANGMSCCSITDHGNMHGHIDFYKSLKAANVKPILGIEAYITNDNDYIEENKDKKKDNWHCILLAKNNKGYEDLIWLNNQAALYNFYYKPRISVKNLVGRCENIIATSACLGGVVSKVIRYDPGNKTADTSDGRAEANLMLFKEIFGSNFYAEIQDDPTRWEQCAYNEWLVKQAKLHKIPMVITSDAHFLSKDDKRVHDLVMAQQLKITVQEYKADEDGLSYGDLHYVRLPNDMLAAAKRYGAEEAYYNTEKIANECNVDLTLGKYKNPLFPYQQETDYKQFLQWKQTGYECIP